MRPSSALLLAALLAPTALAQVPPLPGAQPPAAVSVAMAAFSAPVVPGAQAQTAAITVTVSCALAAASPQTGLPVVLEVTTKPAWASIVIDPSAAVVDIRSCAGPSVDIPAVAYARGGAGGSAGDKGDVVIVARATSQAGEQSGSAAQSLTLGYHGGVGLKLNATSASLHPHESGALTLTVANGGNARSRITFDVTAPDALRVAPLDAITLDASGSAEVRVTFTSVQDTLTGRTDPVTIKATSARDGTGEPGETRNVQLLVATKVPASVTEPGKETPVPSLGIAALALACVAAVRRRR